MSIVIQCLSLFAYSIWRARRAKRDRPAIAPDGCAPPRTAAIEPEDAPDRWLAWTALDDRQLVRLLSDEAP
ncbi:hypothetical protein Y900_004965 [Mycolicibacterium aromaticivorans JS19b1 = JCM 16368]|uniref:Uncharacterized protein n=1 Tax=Mycolicibacterium aromaticivorans JS19b1 = JCM 16368 TaxID=1440774 RepID=A0A064CCI8_9MYCO|nr:hypothetical protein [Mycolicibacterium aromaticivorans]KDE98309.1 hypothetical protein Y900_004965 [Mycolicibacterium aromaticivorans JS19b1 = JCM 16368]